MKAIVYEKYGGPEVLRLEEVEKPAPAADEVLLQVRAAGVNPLDWHTMRGKPFMVRLMAGLLKPNAKILGADVAGRVVAAGGEVEALQVGDDVFGGIGRGAFAEYVAADAEVLVRKPANVTFAEAAAVPVAGLTALQRLRDDGELEAGERVLIVGAAGGVGTYAVQIAKALGAEVTAVCDAQDAAMVRSLGADHVLDDKQEAYTEGEQRYDLILDNVGNRSLAACAGVLSEEGVYLYNSSSMLRIVQVTFKGARMGEAGGRQVRTADLTRYGRADLEVLKEYLESGKVVSVIDRRYPLDRVPEAIAYLEQRRASSKVVIALEEEGHDG